MKLTGAALMRMKFEIYPMPSNIYQNLYRSALQPSVLLRAVGDGFVVVDATSTYMELIKVNELELLGSSVTELSLHYSDNNPCLVSLRKGLLEMLNFKKENSFSSTSESTEWVSETRLITGTEQGENLVLHTIIKWPLSEGPREDLLEACESKSHMNEQRFKHLVQNGTDMIAILSDQGEYSYVSPTSTSILGFSPKDFEGRNVFDFIHPEDSARVFDSFSKLTTKKKLVMDPFRFKHKNGNWRWIETILTDLSDEASVQGIVANSRDITERIESQNSILMANERYRYVTQATAEAIWDWDITNGSLFWGEGFCLLFGYGSSDLHSDLTTWTAKIHPSDVRRVLATLDKFLEEKRSNWSAEYRMIKADGSYAFVADKGFAIFGPEGKAIRIVGALRDISRQKQEEQQLKLLESVVLNTTDSVVITSADPAKDQVGEIIYVNDAFSRMTGYTSTEVIGQSLRILDGARTDYEELDRVASDLNSGRSTEATLINYKKNGDEFWVNFSVTPIADEKGNFNRWISIQRDVTQAKAEDTREKLLSEINLLFNQLPDVTATMDQVLQAINRSGNFCSSEVWLLNPEGKELRLFAYRAEDDRMEQFYLETKNFRKTVKGEGLPGKVWEYQTVQTWDIALEMEDVGRLGAAMNAELKNVFGLPLLYNGQLTGVLTLAGREHHKLEGMAVLSENFAEHLGAEIKRKQLEQELSEVFTFAPDILAILNFKGYFKKINPAACDLLGYTQSELLRRLASSFAHPEDQKATIEKIKSLACGGHALNFENRYLTKSGKTKWLSWTANAVSAEGLIFAVAKDITEKKTLEELLFKTNSLARIGSWEINVSDGTVYWSDITKEIREAEPDFLPDLNTGIQYFKNGKDKNTIRDKVKICMETGTPWDEELEIETFKGNYKWVRTIGQAEMVNGKCLRIFGSFQDIDSRKRAELRNAEIQQDVAESEKRYSELFHFSPLSMWVYDVETLRFLDVNRTAIHSYGFTKEEFLTMTLHNIRPEEELALLEETIRIINENQSPFHHGVFKHRTKTGEILDVDVKSSLMIFKGRKAKLVIASDITKQLEYLNAIEEKNNKLEEIAWIQSHIVRAPLARIMGLVSLFKKGTATKKLTQKDIIGHIEDSANELDEIIMQITVKSDNTRKTG